MHSAVRLFGYPVISRSPFSGTRRSRSQISATAVNTCLVYPDSIMSLHDVLGGAISCSFLCQLLVTPASVGAPSQRKTISITISDHAL